MSTLRLLRMLLAHLRSGRLTVRISQGMPQGFAPQGFAPQGFAPLSPGYAPVFAGSPEMDAMGPTQYIEQVRTQRLLAPPRQPAMLLCGSCQA